jgi:hypothetical protein
MSPQDKLTWICDRLEELTERIAVIEKRLDNHRVAGGYSKEFEKWWKLVPNKTAKRDAADAYQRSVSLLLAEEIPEPHAYLAEKMRLFASSEKASGDFCPHPATWLRGGRYHDDPAVWGVVGAQKRYYTQDETTKAELARARAIKAGKEDP